MRRRRTPALAFAPLLCAAANACREGRLTWLGPAKPRLQTMARCARSLLFALEQRAGRGASQSPQVPQAPDVWPCKSRAPAAARLASELIASVTQSAEDPTLVRLTTTRPGKTSRWPIGES